MAYDFRKTGKKLLLEANGLIDIIGKGGSVLKKIGTMARRDIENFFGIRANVKLWVKVRKDWDDNDSYLTYFKDKIR